MGLLLSTKINKLQQKRKRRSDFLYHTEFFASLQKHPTSSSRFLLSTARGYQVCLSVYRVRYFNMNKPLEAMQILSIETKAAKFFDRLAEGDLLTIADFNSTNFIM